MKVLQAKKFSYNYYKSMQEPRIVKDYEIDFELLSGREYYYQENGHSFTKILQENTILIRKPNSKVWAKGNQSSFILTIDFNDLSDKPCGIYNRNLQGKIQPIANNPLIDNLPPTVVMKNSLEVKKIYQKLIELSANSLTICQELVMQLLYLINAQVCSDLFDNHNETKSSCDIVYSYIKNNFNKNISLDHLAQLVHLEKSYFIRLFKNIYGKTPIDVLIDCRMEHALYLTLATDMKISEIAETCGYKTLSFFIKEYKKRFGYTPLEHRKNITKQNPL
jgi:AraC-like DNA-binding protein